MQSESLPTRHASGAWLIVAGTVAALSGALATGLAIAVACAGVTAWPFTDVETLASYRTGQTDIRLTVTSTDLIAKDYFMSVWVSPV